MFITITFIIRLTFKFTNLKGWVSDLPEILKHNNFGIKVLWSSASSYCNFAHDRYNGIDTCIQVQIKLFKKLVAPVHRRVEPLSQCVEVLREATQLLSLAICWLLACKISTTQLIKLVFIKVKSCKFSKFWRLGSHSFNCPLESLLSMGSTQVN